LGNKKGRPLNHQRTASNPEEQTTRLHGNCTTVGRGRKEIVMAKYKIAGEIGPYIDRLRVKYPYHIKANGGYDAYLCGIQPLLESQDAPIYRFPGGDCVMDLSEGGIEIVEW
jgi:hypothetical protein